MVDISYPPKNNADRSFRNRYTRFGRTRFVGARSVYCRTGLLPKGVQKRLLRPTASFSFRGANTDASFLARDRKRLMWADANCQLLATSGSNAPILPRSSRCDKRWTPDNSATAELHGSDSCTDASTGTKPVTPCNRFPFWPRTKTPPGDRPGGELVPATWPEQKIEPSALLCALLYALTCVSHRRAQLLQA